MKTLEEKINALEDEIAGYVSQLNKDGISDEKWNRLSDMITARSHNLENLQKEKLDQPAGKFICASFMFLNLFESLFCFLRWIRLFQSHCQNRRLQNKQGISIYSLQMCPRQHGLLLRGWQQEIDFLRRSC